MAERFPDGQLYANLRGYDPDQPLEPADVLARFLRALGVPAADVPAERAARYRTVLAGRRVLVLLDILDYLGEAYRQVARYGDALAHQRRSLRLARRSGERGREAGTLNGIGETLGALGHAEDAAAHFAAAARQAREIGDVNQEARALDGMARLRRPTAAGAGAGAAVARAPRPADR